MGKSIEATQARVRDRPHRARLAAPARPRAGRLLRREHAAQAARERRRDRGAPAHDHALRQVLDQADREGDPRVRPRPDAVERRQPGPPRDPRADRGAAQGARQGRARARRGGPRRGPQHPPRLHARPARARKEGEVGEDEERRAEAELQKLTDARVAEIEELLKGKEEEILRGRDERSRPRYVAIIMDGNARWAQSAAGCRRHEGHRAGTDALKRTVKLRGELGIEQLTVYAFSTENWTRPVEEVERA